MLSRMCIIVFFLVAMGNVSALSEDAPPAVQLTRTSGTFPSWSPDGSKIVYSSMRSGEMDIWLMDKDGSNQIPLTFDSGTPSRSSAPVAIRSRTFQNALENSRFL